jgi:uncharacterized protein
MVCHWKELPELGVGMVYWPTLWPLLEAADSPIDVIEVEPQILWHQVSNPSVPYVLDEGAWAQLHALPQPKIAHSVGLPVGGVGLPHLDQLPLLQKSCQRLGAIWASEHLSFNQIAIAGQDYDTGFFLPPWASAEGVVMAVANIYQLQSSLGLPLLIETGVNYLQPRSGEWSDGEFVAAIAEAADCGILLDLHNIWCNQRNGRQSIPEFIAQLPLERVVEIHVAGGEDYEGYWLDAHSGLIEPELMEILAAVVPQLPQLRSLIFEVSPLLIHKVGLNPIRAQLQDLQKIWRTRGQNSRPASRQLGHRVPSSWSLTDWTNTLGSLAIERLDWLTNEELAAGLVGDPGLGVLQHLIQSARSGTVVNALPLTSELLFRQIGGPAYRQIFTDFWQVSPPRMFGGEEAADFTDYLCQHHDALPYLKSIATYEAAQIAAAYQGKTIDIQCAYHPLEIAAFLEAGQLPTGLRSGCYDLQVSSMN